MGKNKKIKVLFGPETYAMRGTKCTKYPPAVTARCNLKA